jgi:hypothetical protein
MIQCNRILKYNIIKLPEVKLICSVHADDKTCRCNLQINNCKIAHVSEYCYILKVYRRRGNKNGTSFIHVAKWKRDLNSCSCLQIESHVHRIRSRISLDKVAKQKSVNLPEVEI